MITKTFAVWSEADINTVTFYRPTGIPDPTPEDIELMLPGAYMRPDNAMPADCAVNPPTKKSTDKKCASMNPSYREVLADL